MNYLRREKESLSSDTHPGSNNPTELTCFPTDACIRPDSGTGMITLENIQEKPNHCDQNEVYKNLHANFESAISSHDSTIMMMSSRLDDLCRNIKDHQLSNNDTKEMIDRHENAINNLKNPSTGELKICRISAFS